MGHEDDRLWGICEEIYRELYRQAEPTADYDGLVRTRPKEKWYKEHYLDQDRQDSIMEGVMKRHKLDRFDKRRIKITMDLGCPPVSHR